YRRHAGAGNQLRHRAGHLETSTSKKSRIPMNRKQLTVLIVAGLVIGAAAIFISKNKDNTQATSNQRLGQKVVKNFPINDVERITVKHANEQMNLVRKDGRWVVAERADYPANFGN